MTLSCFSQDHYPKSLNIEGDTVVLISLVQLGKINNIIVDRNFLRKELILKDSLLIFKDDLIVNKSTQISNLNSVVLNYEQQLKNQDIINQRQKELWSQQRKQYRRRTILYGAGGVVIGTVVGILICK